MLHLARGIALGVDIGDFLELQRPFERQRKSAAAPEIEYVARFGDRLRDLAQPLVMVQDFARARRDLGQVPDQRGLALVGDRTPRPRHGDRQRAQDRELGCKRLGRGDADLGAGEGRQHDIGFARDRAFRLVDNGDDMLPLGFRA